MKKKSANPQQILLPFPLMERVERAPSPKGKVDFYKHKMPIREFLLELERDGIIEFYKDGWGTVKIRITGGWT